jgi:lysophospholipase L1-like esterase
MERASRSREFPLGKKVLFSALIVFLFFFLLDRALKVFDELHKRAQSAKEEAVVSKMLTPSQREDYKRATDLKLYPYVMFRMVPNFHSETINVNSMGFRGKEVEREKREGVFRIIVVGGSAAMGYGSTDDEHAFSQILERLLNAESARMKFEVINAGLAAGISMQEFVVISTELLDLKPDMVIIFDGFNDVVGSVINDRRPNYPWRFETLEKALTVSPTKLFVHKRLRNFRLTRRILDALEEKRKKDLWKSYRSNYPAVEAYLANVRRMCEILKGCSVEPFVVLQPSLYFKKTISDDERGVLDREPPGLESITKPMFQKARAGLRQISQDRNARFLDLSSAFDEHPETIFFDSVHFGDRGQDIVARKLLQELETFESIKNALGK